VDYFWRALADYTPAQRSAFLRFAWGRYARERFQMLDWPSFATLTRDEGSFELAGSACRSRLPASAQEFGRRFEIHSFESFSSAPVGGRGRCLLEDSPVSR